jgi:alkylated DNA nucleotide flippase Atl1
MKQLLLDEGVTFNSDGTVKMEKHFYTFRGNKKGYFNK